MTFYLDNTIIAAAKQANIKVMDERYALLGHELCSSSPWVYSPPDPFPSNTKVLDTSAWFHPTVAGQTQIATDLGKYWQAIQAGTAPTVWPVSVPTPATGWLPANLPSGIPTTVQAQTMLTSLANISAYAGDYNPNACVAASRPIRPGALTARRSWTRGQANRVRHTSAWRLGRITCDGRTRRIAPQAAATGSGR